MAILPIESFTMWLATGERGISSETIVGHLTGVPIRGRNGTGHPYDPSDFRRCEMLLRAVPLARLAFPQMRTCAPTWALLVDRWDEIVALMEEECPGAFDSHAPRGAAPKAYALMRELRDVAA